MRIIYFVVGLFLTTHPLFSQDQTLLSGNLSHGGFWSPGVLISTIGNETAVINSSEFGWIVNHQLVLGGGNTSIMLDVPSPDGLEGKFVDLSYGGIRMEYLLSPEKLVHASFSLLLGPGNVSYYTHRRGGQDNMAEDIIFVICPSVDLLVNVTKNLRFGVAARYRSTYDVDLEGLTKDDISGLSVGMKLALGKF